MAWLRIELTEEERAVVNAERDGHPEAHVRRKMLVLWLLHCGLTREKAAEVAGLGRATVQRYVAAYRRGRPGRPAPLGRQRPGERPGRARARRSGRVAGQPGPDRRRGLRPIEALTGIRRRPTQVRSSSSRPRALKWRRVRAVPVPPKKPPGARGGAGRVPGAGAGAAAGLADAKAGKGHVLFVDAAHFVFGTFLCCLWSFARVFVRAASGRQRFNVLGAWDAVTRELVVGDEHDGGEHRDDVRTAAGGRRAKGLAGPVTLVLDNARYQRKRAGEGAGEGAGDHAAVPAELLAEPEPDRAAVAVHQAGGAVRASTTRRSRTSRAAIEGTIGDLGGKHKDELASLMTLNFQVFDDVSLLAA